MPIAQDILSYGFRGGGKWTLVIGTILSLAADLAGFAPILGLVAIVLLSGYFCAIYFDIIQTTATGSMEAPYMPDTTNVVADLLWPMFQVILVFLVSFGPWIGYGLFSPQEELSLPLFYALLVFGVIYFPMAMLAVVVLGYLGAMSPHIVLPAIFRGGGVYWLAVFMIVLLYMTEGFVGQVLEDRPLLGTFVLAVLGIYAMMTNGRALGIVYRERQEELGWI